MTTQEKFEQVQQVKYKLWANQQEVLDKAKPGEVLVAEGDSWSDYPVGLDLIDQLKSKYKLKIAKVAEAGDTLENMSYGTEIRRNYSRKPSQLYETLGLIGKHQSRVVLLSAGGNDLAGPELSAYLNHSESGLPALREEYAQDVFAGFKKAYRYIFDEVWKINSKAHIFFHGYGGPIPDGRGVNILIFTFAGPWLRPWLARKGLDGKPGEQVMSRLIDLLNSNLKDLEAEDSKGRLHFLDFRNDIKPPDWENELHLSDLAYGRLADKMYAAIERYL